MAGAGSNVSRVLEDRAAVIDRLATIIRRKDLKYGDCMLHAGKGLKDEKLVWYRVAGLNTSGTRAGICEPTDESVDKAIAEEIEDALKKKDLRIYECFVGLAPKARLVIL